MYVTWRFNLYCKLFVILYSGKFSWEKIFANFANYRLLAKILSTNVLFLLTKIGQ